MIKRGILRVWSQVLAASIIIIKQPVATAERYAPVTPYPAVRMLSAHTLLTFASENHKLNLDDYNSGPAAPYNSWVLLDKGD